MPVPPRCPFHLTIKMFPISLSPYLPISPSPYLPISPHSSLFPVPCSL
ncbi:hypothetical protein [Moorena producens]